MANALQVMLAAAALVSCLLRSAEGFVPRHMRFAAPAHKPHHLLSAPVYDAQVPENLGASLVVFGTLAATSFYWWTVIIPQARTKLAISKSRGEVRELLDEIVVDDSAEGSELGPEQKAVLRWFFTDWLKKGPKPAAIPFLKKAKWNSGDNPILVAVGGIMALVLAASLAERASIVIR